MSYARRFITADKVLYLVGVTQMLAIYLRFFLWCLSRSVLWSFSAGSWKGKQKSLVLSIRETSVEIVVLSKMLTRLTLRTIVNWALALKGNRRNWSDLLPARDWLTFPSAPHRASKSSKLKWELDDFKISKKKDIPSSQLIFWLPISHEDHIS